MQFELQLVAQLCKELGLQFEIRSPVEIALHLGGAASLVFQNAEREDDCCRGFAGTPWHTHDKLICVDRHGSYAQLDYLEVIAGLADRTVLICELWRRGTLSDRWLVHKDHVDEFRRLERNDEIRIRPASLAG
jgi:hypothetical protein